MTPSLSASRLVAEHRFADLWLATVEPAGSGVPAATGSGLLQSGGRTLGLKVKPSGFPPQTHVERGVGVVLEGVLYERDRLLRHLMQEERQTIGDAELLLHAYLEWGPELLSRLKGIFSFCLWDGHARRLLAARDRVGVYPLFYRQRGEQIQFSTTTDAFGALGPGGLDVNPVVVAGLVARHHPDVEETFYGGVRRVPPGHLLTLQQGGLSVERHWRPAPVGAGASWVGEDELGRFGELLDQAVGRALDMGRAGVYLSGGLDSVSVAAAALDHGRKRGMPAPHALSLLFPDEVNEEHTQRGVSEKLGIEQSALHLQESVAPRGLIASALALSATSAAPLQNVWLPAYHELGLIGRRQGCRVILTGGGGDEWLTVTPLVAADFIRRGDIGGLARYLAALQRSLDLPRLPLWRNVIWGGGLRPLLRAEYGRALRTLAPESQRRRVERRIRGKLRSLPEWITPDPALSGELGRRIEARAHQRQARSAAPGPGGFYFAEMERSLGHPLFAVDMEEIFESGRRLGMLQFDVYWDADLIEFLYRVPPHLLNSGGRSKGLVRRDLARRFPSLGFDRQKKLLSRDFFCSLLLREGEKAWKDMGGAQALADLGIVEPRALDRYATSVFQSGEKRGVDDVWRILSLESWVRPRV